MNTDSYCVFFLCVCVCVCIYAIFLFTGFSGLFHGWPDEHVITLPQTCPSTSGGSYGHRLSHSSSAGRSVRARRTERLQQAMSMTTQIEPVPIHTAPYLPPAALPAPAGRVGTTSVFDSAGAASSFANRVLDLGAATFSPGNLRNSALVPAVSRQGPSAGVGGAPNDLIFSLCRKEVLPRSSRGLASGQRMAEAVGRPSGQRLAQVGGRNLIVSGPVPPPAARYVPLAAAPSAGTAAAAVDPMDLIQRYASTESERGSFLI
jgi:hypothetical protein